MTGSDDHGDTGATPPDDQEPVASGDGADAAEAPAHGDMDPLMLELLVCPLTKNTLTFDAETNELVSEAAGLAYPVRGGIPVLLPSEARSLRDDPR